MAAAGVVSLSSVAQAQEAAANAVQTKLATTSLSGYISTSYNWVLGDNTGAQTGYRLGDAENDAFSQTGRHQFISMTPPVADLSRTRGGFSSIISLIGINISISILLHVLYLLHISTASVYLYNIIYNVFHNLIV